MWVSKGWGMGGARVSEFSFKESKSKKKIFLGGGEGGARGSDFFYKNPNLKKIYIFFFFFFFFVVVFFFFLGGGGLGGEVRWGQWEARVSKFLLLSTRI